MSDSVEKVEAMAQGPFISLVVCTRNRAKYLPAALASIRRLHCSQPWEIVLVDSASTDKTSELLQEFAKSAPVQTRVLHSAKPGLSVARNAGWRAARGQIIAFTDDDCYPWPDYLEVIAKVFREHPEVGFAGGRVLLHDPADLPTTIQLLNQVKVIQPRSYVESGFIHGANFSLRRPVIERLGGFDTRLGAGARLVAGEDTDIMVRASAAGATGRYDPEIVVEHHHRRQDPLEVRRMDRGYAIGRGAYHAKVMLDGSIFNRKLKYEYLRNWYWSVRAQLRDGKRLQVAQEFLGVFKYLMIAVREGRHVAD